MLLSGTLSSSTSGMPFSSTEVIFFRHSSAFCLSGMDSPQTGPMATMPRTVTINVLPVPWTGASTMASGTCPAMTGRMRMDRRMAMALARLAESANGNSMIKSTRVSLAASTSSGDGFSGMGGTTRPGSGQ